MKKKPKKTKLTKRILAEDKVLDNAIQPLVKGGETKKVLKPKYPGVFINAAYKTYLAFERKDGKTRGLQILNSGLQIISVPDPIFDKDYRFCAEHLIDRAAEICAEFMKYLGASDEAIEVLKTFRKLTTEEITMAKATAKKRVDPEVPASSAKGKAKAAKAKKGPVTREQTASRMFQQLIMEGKLTDDQIFAKVKTEFGLDDKKRGYVAWYRNHLKKNGSNPPEAKTA